MVCDRCVMAVDNELQKLQIKPIQITLGEVDLGSTQLTPNQLISLSSNLQEIGFEVIDDKKSRIIDRIKTIIIE